MAKIAVLGYGTVGSLKKDVDEYMYEISKTLV